MDVGARQSETFKVGVFRGYDDPRSNFSRRLIEAQRAVRDALTSLPTGPVVVLDICGGVGRVLIPAAADHPRKGDVRGTIIDLDGASMTLAREALQSQRMTSIQAVTADAGVSDSYAGLERASLVILSGVLAHLSPTQQRRLLQFTRQVAAPQAVLLWTIGARVHGGRIRRVRRAVAGAGFETVRVTQVGRTRLGLGPRHEVGLARLRGPIEPLQPNVRIFSFRPTLWQRFPLLRAVGRALRRRLPVLLGRSTVAR